MFNTLVSSEHAKVSLAQEQQRARDALEQKLKLQLVRQVSDLIVADFNAQGYRYRPNTEAADTFGILFMGLNAKGSLCILPSDRGLDTIAEVADWAEEPHFAGGVSRMDEAGHRDALMEVERVKGEAGYQYVVYARIIGTRISPLYGSEPARTRRGTFDPVEAVQWIAEDMAKYIVKPEGE